jgi:hypothetical protein
MAEESTWYDEGLRFTCTQCGNCCSGPPGYVWFNDEELKAMADDLAMTPKKFREMFAVKHGGRWSLREVEGPRGFDCVFLRRDAQGKALCSIYKSRPTQCRTWPFWPELLKSFRSYVNGTSTCPGTKRGLEGEGNFYPIEKIRILRDATADASP